MWPQLAAFRNGITLPFFCISFLLSSGGLEKKVPALHPSWPLPTVTEKGRKSPAWGSGPPLPSQCDFSGAFLPGGPHSI